MADTCGFGCELGGEIAEFFFCESFFKLHFVSTITFFTDFSAYNLNN